MSQLLVAVSSPWASDKLAQPIADLARRLDASVFVAHVATLQETDEHESDATQRGEQTLQLFTDRLKQAGVEAEGIMLFSDDTAKAILNTARSGRFSSDQTIGEYARDIWRVGPCPVDGG